MDEIFANAKSILTVWIDDTDPENLPNFQETLKTKAKQAHLVFESVEMLSESRRATSSFDLILFDLVSKKDSSTDIDLLNEFFRLLRPNGHLITHIEHNQQTQAIGHFKMCGFTNCNPLDSNSSFLIENKDTDAKRLGSLWLCQKPSFDIGYSVPLRRTGVSLIRQISTTGGGKKTWTVENDDDDMVDADHLHDENDRQKPDVKNYDSGTTSTDIQKPCENCTCGLAEKHAAAKDNVKSSGGNYYPGDAFQCAGCPVHGLASFKPGERANLPTMSDV